MMRTFGIVISKISALVIAVFAVSSTTSLAQSSSSSDEDTVCCRGFYGENHGFMSRKKCVGSGGDVAPRSFCLAPQTIFGNKIPGELPPQENATRTLDDFSDEELSGELRKLWPAGSPSVASLRQYNPSPPQLNGAVRESPYKETHAALEAPTKNAAQLPEQDSSENTESVATIIQREIMGIFGDRIDQRVSPGLDPRLNVESFLNDLDAVLQNMTVGYRIEVQRNGEIIEMRQSGVARKQMDGRLLWDDDVSIHLASTSKIITAAALMRTLRAHGISPDDRISDYLPDYWQRGGHTHLLTFRHIMTHTSGLGDRADVDKSEGEKFDTARRHIEQGIGPAPDSSTGAWPFAYKNSNFALARILIGTIEGDLNLDYSFLTRELTERFWDYVTIEIYKDYVQRTIFEPAGVYQASLKRREKTALAYHVDLANTLPGWNSGDLTAAAGPIGWHLTTGEMLAVARALRTPDLILSAEDFAEMQYGKLGIFPSSRLDNLQVFQHGGRWGNGDEQAERSALFFAPGNVEIAIMVSSDYRPYFAALIDAYEANLIDP